MAGKKKQFVVFGVGRFGASLCRTLCDMGHEVLAVDGDEDVINDIAPYVTRALTMDATDEEAFARIGVRNFDAAIVSIGDMRDSILVSLLCREGGAKYVVCKASDEMHAKVLVKVGVDRVVFPERDMGARLARSITTPNVLDLINLSEDYAIETIAVPKEWIGKTLCENDIRRRYGVSVLVVQRDKRVLADINGDMRLEEHDIVTVLGDKKAVEKVEGLS